ncbi:hypothetical protein ACG9ZL_12560 [Acinetobacter sp. ULE_I057]|uniref:hypothetical protein n=1 Tax=Acinetobacter sp. ULE_I057 TaxID=3373070 RepID=UPI003AF42A40
MKIYEMIFHKGTYEKTRLFYAENNKASRQHFIENMRLELDRELNDFIVNCKSSYKHDLFDLYKKVQKESHLHLDVMEDEFIQNSKATFDQCICLSVKSHEVFNIIKSLI